MSLFSPELPAPLLNVIFRGVWPFFALLLVAVVILMFFPQIAIWLPSTM